MSETQSTEGNNQACTSGSSPPDLATASNHARHVQRRKCPRCLGPLPVEPSDDTCWLSYTDNSTYVCGTCGIEERYEYRFFRDQFFQHSRAAAAMRPLVSRVAKKIPRQAIARYLDLFGVVEVFAADYERHPVLLLECVLAGRLVHDCGDPRQLDDLYFACSRILNIAREMKVDSTVLAWTLYVVQKAIAAGHLRPVRDDSSDAIMVGPAFASAG